MRSLVCVVTRCYPQKTAPASLSLSLLSFSSRAILYIKMQLLMRVYERNCFATMLRMSGGVVEGVLLSVVVLVMYAFPRLFLFRFFLGSERLV